VPLLFRKPGANHYFSSRISFITNSIPILKIEGLFPIITQENAVVVVIFSFLIRLTHITDLRNNSKGLGDEDK